MNSNAQRYELDQPAIRSGSKDELFAETLNHFRHDWMNDIQVLYGYLKLKKYDKMHDYMETIREKLIGESCISKLGDPALVVYLQSYRARCRSIRLDVELGPDVQLSQLSVDSGTVSDAIIAVIEAFTRQGVAPADGDVNRLRLKLSIQSDCLVIGFDYDGGYRREELLQELREALGAGRSKLRIASGAVYDSEKAVFDIHVPIQIQS